MSSFIGSHHSTVALIVLGTGGLLLAGGVALHVELTRRREQEVWLRTLNTLRSEMGQLRQEVDTMRAQLCQLVDGARNHGASAAISRAPSNASFDSTGNYVDASDAWSDFDTYLYSGKVKQTPRPSMKYLKIFTKAKILSGKKFASKAHDIDSSDFNALKLLTLLTGAATDFQGIRKRIEEGQIFKKLLDKALSMQPNDHMLLHLRGRYYYAVATLSWAEKAIAARFSKSFVAASIEDALNDFLEVERLRPRNWIDNLLYVAKCYMAKNDRRQALKFLKIASRLKASDETEQEYLKEVFTLLQKFND
ncbi:unnamed protein product [Gongylonema pulchrum]|uniref:TPR_REGION domain-containing protein n=1 Tax=Gongylonema pulchrum TaxID=637853 RepID=A0A183DRR7_9BILA|nr:unnamed protein product [Gongylonema pulchrum]